MRVRGVLFVAAVWACEGGRSARPPTVAPEPVVRDATADAVTTPEIAPHVMPPAIDGPVEEPDAPPTVKQLDVPDKLASAPVWTGRQYMTGAVRARTPHTTYKLHRDGTQALLVVEVRRPRAWAARRPGAEPTAWRTESVTYYLGSAVQDGQRTKISVANGSESLAFTCKRTKVSAARADAVRGRTPGIGGCEGDTGRWVPSAATRVQVLACEPEPRDPDRDDEWEKLAFAPAPGIEWLHVNDDCVIQGGGWRRVPADGSIGPVRPPSKASE